MITVRNARKPRGRILKVKTGPGQFILLDEAAAIEKGYIQDKGRAHLLENKEAPQQADETEDKEVIEAFDFTVIPGVGPASARALAARGIKTLEAAQGSDLTFLSAGVAEAIKAF